VFRYAEGGKNEEVALKVGEQPENVSLAGTPGPRNPGGRTTPETSPETLGMRLATPDDAMVQRFGLTEKQGAMVTSVQPRSAAYRAGVRPGDLITKVGRTDVKSAKEATEAISKQNGGKGVLLRVTNSLGSRFVFVE